MKLTNEICISFLRRSGWLYNHDKEITISEHNKAIDDFVKALRIEYSPVSDEMQNEYDNVCLRLEKIAEQLKAGGKE